MTSAQHWNQVESRGLAYTLIGVAFIVIEVVVTAIGVCDDGSCVQPASTQLR